MYYFGKVITAMVTPFDKDLQVDIEATRKLVDHLIENNSDAIVVAGTTGEGPTLSKEEKLNLFSVVSERVKGRVPVIANVGSNNTSESIAFAQEVERMNIVDGLMLVNPYYNKPSQEGLFVHFEAIATSVKLPILLYNIPGRTGVNLQWETTVALSKIKNIIAIKEASGDLTQVSFVIENTPDNFGVYSGDDDLTLPIVAIGGAGVVSVVSHVFGPEIKRMIERKDATLHRKLTPFVKAMFAESNPVPIKSALNLIGQCVGSVRMPLVDLREDGHERVKQAYEKALVQLEGETQLVPNAKLYIK